MFSFQLRLGCSNRRSVTLRQGREALEAERQASAPARGEARKKKIKTKTE
jgi:hypothetical protein